jgi:hypothetical protein
MITNVYPNYEPKTDWEKQLDIYMGLGSINLIDLI